MKKYYPIIGIEIHIELNTMSKMFCQCSTEYFNKKPNTEVCPVCLGLPGALPVPNQKAIEYTQLVAKSLNCKLSTHSKFDRKHYFYPDLPKGYQISQYDKPFGENGYVNINNKKFRIQRVHLEEDAGKLIHKPDSSYVDFNRSGVPLVEIVTHPDFDNSEDVKNFLEYLHLLVQQYLKISNANMEEGSMRLEPNISLTTEKGILPNYKIEIKNVNSFKFVKKSIDFEIIRQTELLNKKIILKNETRGFNENKNITFSQRSKEEAKDYRYFPEPDIPIFNFNEKDLEKIKIPELPFEKLDRYINDLNIKKGQAEILIKNNIKTFIFERLLIKFKDLNPIIVANFIINRTFFKSESIDDIYKKLKDSIKSTTLNHEEIIKILPDILKNNPKALEDYRSGKENALYFLIGQIIKNLGGKLDVSELKKLLIKEIQK
ncbi:MAG: Asp-tRNA(Asn)/Glu-tRNA(Gln) amidotransferase subunit GatB [bacterium]